MKQIETTGDVTVCLANETCIAVSGNDLEVSDLIVVVDVVLDEVAVRSPMPTKRTDARLSLSGSVITENPPWPRVFWEQIEAVCHHHLVVSEKEIVIASGKEITIVLPAHAATMTATTTAKEEIEKMNARDCIAVVPTADHTTNLTMGMNVHPALDVVVQTMKTNTLVVIRAMLRYEYKITLNCTGESIADNLNQRTKRERSRERTPPRAEERPRKKTPPPATKDVHSGSEEGEIEED